MYASSLPPVVCSRAQVLLTLFVFVWFVFTSCCLYEGSSLIYVIYVCLRIVVSNTYCIVCVFCLFFFPCVARFTGLTIFDCRLVFANVYFHLLRRFLFMLTYILEIEYRLILEQNSGSYLWYDSYTTCILLFYWGRRGRDRVVVDFTSSYVICAYHH